MKTWTCFNKDTNYSLFSGEQYQYWHQPHLTRNNYILKKNSKRFNVNHYFPLSSIKLTWNKYILVSDSKRGNETSDHTISKLLLWLKWYKVWWQNCLKQKSLIKCQITITKPGVLLQISQEAPFPEKHLRIGGCQGVLADVSEMSGVCHQISNVKWDNNKNISRTKRRKMHYIEGAKSVSPNITVSPSIAILNIWMQPGKNWNDFLSKPFFDF